MSVWFYKISLEYWSGDRVLYGGIVYVCQYSNGPSSIIILPDSYVLSPNKNVETDDGLQIHVDDKNIILNKRLSYQVLELAIDTIGSKYIPVCPCGVKWDEFEKEKV